MRKLAKYSKVIIIYLLLYEITLLYLIREQKEEEFLSARGVYYHPYLTGSKVEKEAIASYKLPKDKERKTIPVSLCIDKYAGGNYDYLMLIGDFDFDIYFFYGDYPEKRDIDIRNLSISENVGICSFIVHESYLLDDINNFFSFIDFKLGDSQNTLQYTTFDIINNSECTYQTIIAIANAFYNTYGEKLNSIKDYSDFGNEVHNQREISDFFSDLTKCFQE